MSRARRDRRGATRLADALRDSCYARGAASDASPPQTCPMIRHRQRLSETISFFSFLSVISCTIGLLMFVLAGVTVVSFWGAEQVIIEIQQQKGGAVGFGRVYVECRREGLVVYPTEELVRAEDLAHPTRWYDSEYARVLARLSTRQRAGSLYFLVRPKGFPVFRRALGYAFASGGGTADAVAGGSAKFTIGHQMVLMPGPIRILRRQEGGQR